MMECKDGGGSSGGGGGDGGSGGERHEDIPESLEEKKNQLKCECSWFLW